MRIKKFSNVLAFVVVGVGGTLVGYFATTRSSAAKSMWDGAAPPISTTTKARDAAAPNFEGRTYPSVASYGGSQPQVVFANDAVIIDASYRIRDRRPNLGYVWAVHFFLPDDTEHEHPIFEHWFEDRLIKVGGEEFAKPILCEWLSVPLPPGEYRVFVGAYRVTAEEGMAGIKAKPIASLVNKLEGPAMGTFSEIGL